VCVCVCVCVVVVYMGLWNKNCHDPNVMRDMSE
jgi:hypothetical protein